MIKLHLKTAKRSKKPLLVALAVLLSACDVSEKDSGVFESEVMPSTQKLGEPASYFDDGRQSSEARYPTEVYFGDTHLHTSNSGDAFAFGARLSPDQAYNFAKGEAVTSTSGQIGKLSKPLDFLVVADHAEGLGVMQGLLDGNPELVKDPQLTRWSEMINIGGMEALKAAREIIRGLANKTLPEAISDPEKSAPFARSVWAKYVQTAERHNAPGEFTSLIGYEFTSQPKGDNLHRVVVFRDGAEKVADILPFSSIVSENPEDLWSELQKYENQTGGRALAIPHNSNLSNGRMFALADFEGAEIDGDYAKKRARWEPLIEATQIKGDSESHPFLSPNDEYASYGDQGWEQGNLTLQTAKTEAMLAGDYAREGLKRGLKIGQKIGVNPYKFGMIGSTDSHTGLATGDENNFFGKNILMEPRAERANKVYKKAEAGAIYGWQYLAGGYAAVWARENTRESLFDAMLRKEVYASTGPRIKLRFFGGYDYEPKMSEIPEIAKQGYALGVPMGGDLSNSGEGQVPNFLVRALKDPDGSNLALLQIVKGWVEESGALKEQVYDIQTAQTEAGSIALSAFWQDPDFNPKLSAFYYVRALETPSVRWPVLDAEQYDIKIPEQAKVAVQERVYSSPIWYTP
jgi:hypothetical protein